MKRREIIEFEVGKMEFGGTSSTIIGKRNVQMKGGITGQKVKASVKKANSQKADVKLLEVLETKEANYRPLYDLDLSIKEKIEVIAKEIYGASGVAFDKKAITKMKKYEAQGLGKLPICVAKTQYSLSDQPTLLGRPSGFTIKINDLIPSAGAGFLVAISGSIMRMPGLPKRPAAVNMDIDKEGKITGLF